MSLAAVNTHLAHKIRQMRPTYLEAHIAGAVVDALEAVMPSLPSSGNMFRHPPQRLIDNRE